MRINDDFSRAVFIDTESLPWAASPAPGVERRMLFRIGEEAAKATSIVRYAPGSNFARHTHAGGEEILVLEGVFQDEHGDYPAGTYFRNPPGTAHTPASQEGCTIFVRLWQFQDTDREQIVRFPGEGQPAPLREGAMEATVLFESGAEEVRIERWSANAQISVDSPDGLELLVIEGALEAAGQSLPARSWVRLPAGGRLTARVGAEGAAVWMKLAPLARLAASEDGST